MGQVERFEDLFEVTMGFLIHLGPQKQGAVRCIRGQLTHIHLLRIRTILGEDVRIVNIDVRVFTKNMSSSWQTPSVRKGEDWPGGTTV